MRRFISACLLLVAPSFFGCPGNVAWTGNPDAPGGTNTGNSARALFEENVKPALQTKCGNCHADNGSGPGPKFLGANSDAYYEALVADPRYLNVPANSLLLLQGEHTGPAFAEPEQNSVTEWLNAEVLERDIGGTPSQGGKPTTLVAGLERFGECMSLTDWYDTGMDNVADQNTSEGRCYSCHNTGMAGAFLDTDPDGTFEMNRARPYVLKLVTGSVDSSGAFDDLDHSWRFRDKGNECDTVPEACSHPMYILSDSRRDALMQFVDLTLERYRQYDTKCGT